MSLSFYIQNTEISDRLILLKRILFMSKKLTFLCAAALIMSLSACQIRKVTPKTPSESEPAQSEPAQESEPIESEPEPVESEEESEPVESEPIESEEETEPVESEEESELPPESETEESEPVESEEPESEPEESEQESEPEESEQESEQESEPESESLELGFYLIGDHNEWTIDEDSYMSQEECDIENVKEQYSMHDVNLVANQELLVVYVNGDDPTAFVRYGYGIFELDPRFKEGDTDEIVALYNCQVDIYFKVYNDDSHGIYIYVDHEDSTTYTVNGLPDTWTETGHDYLAWAWDENLDNYAGRYDVTVAGGVATVEIPARCTGFLLLQIQDGKKDQWSNTAWDTFKEDQSRDFKGDELQNTTLDYEIELETIAIVVNGIPNIYLGDRDIYFYYWNSAKPSEFVAATVDGTSATANLPVDIGGFLAVVMEDGKAPGWSGTDGFVMQTSNFPYVSGTLVYTWPN